MCLKEEPVYFFNCVRCNEDDITTVMHGEAGHSGRIIMRH